MQMLCSMKCRYGKVQAEVTKGKTRCTANTPLKVKGICVHDCLCTMFNELIQRKVENFNGG
uniref:Uncharacterized protein n=1 Tax=Manihot esculenta TaxID=3983 RepID=A0A2C9U5K3_MANES